MPVDAPPGGRERRSDVIGPGGTVASPELQRFAATIRKLRLHVHSQRESA